MRSRTKAIAVAVVAAAMLAPAGAAMASTTYVAWSHTLPQLQQPIKVGTQSKTTSGAGNIYVLAVTDGFTVNAHMCKYQRE